MMDFDQLVNIISFGESGDFESFRISKMMLDFLEITIDDFSGYSFIADKEVMQKLYQVKGNEDAANENDTGFLRSGYGSKYYLDTIGVSEDKCYVVISKEDGTSILSGGMVDILAEILSTTVGLTSWQIACRLIRSNTV